MVAITFAGCKKDNSDNDNPGSDTELLYGVKTGKITYKYTTWDGSTPVAETQTVIFDDNGKRIRVEVGDDDAVIYDAIVGKMYVLFASEKKYTETPFSSYGALTMYLFYGDDVNSAWKAYPGFSQKSDKTVAGKKCSVYSWNGREGETAEWGGWNRITFWMQYYTGSPETDGSSRLEATAFTETIPANSFTVPSDYIKMTY